MPITYPINTRRTLKVNTGPFRVDPGEDNVYRVKLNVGRKGWTLQELHYFMGRDYGDEAEMDIEVYDGTRPLYLRSDHGLKEYDAWTYLQGWWHIEEGITIALLARANGWNSSLERDWIRPHFGIYLNWNHEIES